MTCPDYACAAGQSLQHTPGALRSLLQDCSHSFIAEYEGKAVAVVVATAAPQQQAAAASTSEGAGPLERVTVQLQCVAAHWSLQEIEEVLCCLVHFLLQQLLLTDHVTALEEGASCC